MCKGITNNDLLQGLIKLLQKEKKRKVHEVNTRVLELATFKSLVCLLFEKARSN